MEDNILGCLDCRSKKRLTALCLYVISIQFDAKEKVSYAPNDEEASKDSEWRTDTEPENLFCSLIENAETHKLFMSPD